MAMYVSCLCMAIQYFFYQEYLLFTRLLNEVSKITQHYLICFIALYAIKMWSMRESKKLHVTFGDFKRIVNFQDGDSVLDLRHYFLREFSDILSDDIAPANVRFQRYDDTFEDYTDLAKDAKLREQLKLRVLITSKHVTKVRWDLTL